MSNGPRLIQCGLCFHPITDNERCLYSVESGTYTHFDHSICTQKLLAKNFSSIESQLDVTKDEVALLLELLKKATYPYPTEKDKDIGSLKTKLLRLQKEME